MSFRKYSPRCCACNDLILPEEVSGSLKQSLAVMDPAGFGRKQACCSIGLSSVVGACRLAKAQANQGVCRRATQKILDRKRSFQNSKGSLKKTFTEKVSCTFMSTCDFAVSHNLLFGLTLIFLLHLYIDNFLTRLVPPLHKKRLGPKLVDNPREFERVIFELFKSCLSFTRSHCVIFESSLCRIFFREKMKSFVLSQWIKISMSAVSNARLLQ